MSERPFMQLYVSDFLGDTLMLSAEELGTYILLLSVAHHNGGVLPLDERKLRRITRLTAKQFSRVWPSIDGYFTEEDGFLSSNHLRAWAIKERLVGRRPLSIATREFVIRRDGAKCSYCGTLSGPFHIDHVIAVALGGSDDPTNLVVACKPCNLSKGAKSLEEWQA